MHHAVWKGSISFGLVNIPVKLYTATVDHDLKFSLLHKSDHSKIRYARICKEEDKEVNWEEIVKGFEYEKGEYVVLTEEDFKEVNKNRSKTIDIINFAQANEIDSLYYLKPYFLEPEKNASNAYHLLREALQKSKKVGIAKFVIHNREHLAVIKPYQNLLLLNEMRYDQEIQSTKGLELGTQEKIPSKELEFALKLIDQRTVAFNPKKYVDTYVEEVKEMIEQKAKGKKIHAKGTKPKSPKVHDIMQLLKDSLEQDSKQKPKKPRKKTVA